MLFYRLDNYALNYPNTFNWSQRIRIIEVALVFGCEFITINNFNNKYLSFTTLMKSKLFVCVKELLRYLNLSSCCEATEQLVIDNLEILLDMLTVHSSLD